MAALVLAWGVYQRLNDCAGASPEVGAFKELRDQLHKAGVLQNASLQACTNYSWLEASWRQRLEPYLDRERVLPRGIGVEPDDGLVLRVLLLLESVFPFLCSTIGGQTFIFELIKHCFC